MYVCVCASTTCFIVAADILNKLLQTKKRIWSNISVVFLILSKLPMYLLCRLMLFIAAEMSCYTDILLLRKILLGNEIVDLQWKNISDKLSAKITVLTKYFSGDLN